MVPDMEAEMCVGFYVYWYFAYMCLMRVSNTLELELHTVVSNHVGAKN